MFISFIYKIKLLYKYAVDFFILILYAAIW